MAKSLTQSSKKFNKFDKKFHMKYYKFLLATTCYILLLLGIYYIHVNFFKVRVVLYDAILDSIIVLGICTIIFFRSHSFRLFSRFEKFQMIIIWIFAGYIFAISIPTVIDRSLSFYILEKLQQRGGGILLARFEEVFTDEYVKEHRLIDVRLTEQKESGTIIIQDGCVKLTERGHQLASFSRYFRNHFLPKQRLLMGEYTDDLTDPFRHSDHQKNYQCQ